MPGRSSNEFFSRDEALHCEFSCLLHQILAPEFRASKETIVEIISEAMEIEKQFVENALPVSLIGINSKSMVQYVEYVADYWLRIEAFFIDLSQNYGP